jgi:hypothetical protein
MKINKNPMVLNKGKQVPLTAELLREKIKAAERIDLILFYVALSKIKMVNAIEKINATHLKENKVIALFAPWLDNPQKENLINWKSKVKVYIQKLHLNNHPIRLSFPR